MANTMYNEEQKERWLESIDLKQYPVRYWDILFEYTKPFEEEFGKDVYNFNKVEIKSMYLRLNFTSYERAMVANYNLARYTSWAKEQELVVDGINHYKDINDEDLLSCVNLRQLKQSIVTRDDVIRATQTATNALDAFITLAIFEGIRGKSCEDLAFLNMSDFNGNEVTLKSGKVLTVSDRLVRLAHETNDSNEYIKSDGMKQTLFGPHIIKVASITYTKSGAEERSGRNIQELFFRAASSAGWSDQVSMNSLFISGIIDMVNRLAVENNMTGEQVIYNDELFEQVSYRYNVARPVRRRFILKYGDFLQ